MVISEEQNQKFLKHLTKVNGYNSGDFFQLYDKYLTLYTGYNMLFNEIPEILRNKGIKLHGSEREGEKATVLIAQFLNTEATTKLINDNEEDIGRLIWVIEKNIFNIKLDYKGNPDKNKDASILAGLKSKNEDEKFLAMVQVIYFVRCNMSHGSKALEEYQRLLLEPLVNILSTLVDGLYKTMIA
ncbi:hypothetical protein [Mucilaginibacter sp.]|uniref:hypothetical protein n=1 Tax=Mucilaginibacter sp. TaxID=1882438 RepID=UPI002848DD26|nr:hypothetical protein [Mucilaginibacter sp.]MDR3696469.1 hypothetical protein [Mucilaginibacter sp.]